MAAVEPAAGAAVLECDVSASESTAQTSSFVTISLGDAVPVWIIDPVPYYALLEKKPQIYLLGSKNGKEIRYWIKSRISKLTYPPPS